MRSARRLAEWGHVPGCSCSRTSLGCCLLTAGTLWPVSFTDWPRSATWDATGFSELPTSAPRISGSGGSASPGLLLPTPEASDGTGGRVSSEMGGSRPSGSKRAVTVSTAVAHLLPTPAARDWKSGQSNMMDRNARPLNEVVEMLLPTPNATDWKGSGQTQGRARDGKLRTAGDADLPEAVALLPTPTAMDSHGSRNSTQPRQPDSTVNVADTLTDAVTILTGARTRALSADGRPSSGVPRQAQLSLGEPDSDFLPDL